MAIHCTMTQLEYNSIRMPNPVCDEEEIRSLMTAQTDLTGLPFRMLYAYSRINPELEHKTNPNFNRRFFESLSSECPGISTMRFPEDFKPLIDDMYNASLKLKAKRAAINAELRQKMKDDPTFKAELLEEKEEEKKFNMIAIVNGEEEPISGNTIEPEGIFFGRGESQFHGYWKYQVEPEEVTLNWISPEGHEPPAAPEGHHWAGTRQAPNSHVLATYKTKVGTATQKWHGNKKVQFAANSSLKKGADKLKFENAVKLSKKHKSIMHKVDEFLNGTPSERQTGALVWLVAYTGIRIGAEKEGIWDNGSVGASTLLVENLEVNGNVIHLDFIGKDSVHDVRDIEVPDNIATAIASFKEGKGPKDQIFDKASEGSVNEFLSDIMPGATAKLLRTYVANDVMERSLRNETAKVRNSGHVTTAKLVDAFKKANFDVATQLNHQTNVSKGYEGTVEKMTENIAASEEKLQKQIEVSRAKIKRLSDIKAKIKIPEAAASYDEKIAKEEALIQKRMDAFEAKNLKLAQKKLTKNTALGTSLNAYISPKVVKAWCDANDVDVKLVYPKGLIQKYSWAFEEEGEDGNN